MQYKTHPKTPNLGALPEPLGPPAEAFPREGHAGPPSCPPGPGWGPCPGDNGEGEQGEPCRVGGGGLRGKTRPGAAPPQSRGGGGHAHPPPPPPRSSMNLLNERDVTNAFRKKPSQLTQSAVGPLLLPAAPPSRRFNSQ